MPSVADRIKMFEQMNNKKPEEKYTQPVFNQKNTPGKKPIHQVNDQPNPPSPDALRRAKSNDNEIPFSGFSASNGANGQQLNEQRLTVPTENEQTSLARQSFVDRRKRIEEALKKPRPQVQAKKAEIDPSDPHLQLPKHEGQIKISAEKGMIYPMEAKDIYEAVANKMSQISVTEESFEKSPSNSRGTYNQGAKGIRLPGLAPSGGSSISNGSGSSNNYQTSDSDYTGEGGYFQQQSSLLESVINVADPQMIRNISNSSEDGSFNQPEGDVAHARIRSFNRDNVSHGNNNGTHNDHRPVNPHHMGPPIPQPPKNTPAPMTQTNLMHKMEATNQDKRLKKADPTEEHW